MDPRSESGESLPKITALPGSLHLEYRTCGTPTCRCARGKLHGPYLTRRWSENGKQRKAYVRPEHREDVAAGIALWRRLHPPAWKMRQELAALHTFEKEADS